MSDMHIFNGVRYRVEDALRLGLITKGAVVTARSENVRMQREAHAPAGLVTTQAASLPGTGDEVPDGGADRPNKGQSKAIWAKYALDRGVTPEQLEGLKRDEIIALLEDLDSGDGDGDE